jgi:ABC-type multidrug transport system, permease component
MAYIYGITEENMFTGKSSFQPITVDFKYNKDTEQGKYLTLILKDQSVKNFIEASSGDTKCIVTISDDFKKMNIEKLKGSDNEVEMVKAFMQTFADNINQYSSIINNVSTLSLTSTQKQELQNKLVAKFSESNSTPLLQEQVMDGYRTLGAREYYTISIFSFTSLMLITTLIKKFYRDRKQGVIRRSFSTPSSKGNYLAGYIISSLILTFIINFGYIIINRMMNVAFKESLIELILMVILQSLLQSAVIGAVVAFIKNENIANAIMSVIIFVPCIVGGIFYNADVVEIKALKVLSQLSPNSLILNLYKNISVAQGYVGAINEIIIITALALSLIIASLIKVRIKWED